MEKVSVIVGCANRADVLVKTIPSWLSKKEISEIVITDWNSKRLVSKDLAQFKDKRIKIIRVNNCGEWVLSLALNVAARYVTSHLILKLDTDNILGEDFFSAHPLKSTDRIFYTGNWENARDENEKHLNGVVFIPTQEFRSVNGYNEYIRSYGFDDTDLYNRLMKNGMVKKDISNDTISHVPHDNSRRSPHSDLDLSTSRNMFLCDEKRCPWKESVVRTEYIKGARSGGHWDTISPGNLDHFTPPPSVFEECTVLALRNVLNKHGFSWESTERKSRDFLQNLYEKRKLPKLVIEPKNGLGNRLRALASAATIAKNQNLNLLVVWIPDVHYQSRFSEHFDDSELCVVSSAPSNLSISKSVPKEGCNSFSNIIDLVQDIVNDIYIVSATVINHISTTWTAECNWIKNNIKPLPWLKNKIKEFKKLFSIKKAIGVHVRMGQDGTVFPFEDWSRYTSTQREAASLNRGESHYVHFMKEMEKVWAVNPEQKFFLCADSEEVYAAFKKRFPRKYGSHIIHTKKNVWDRSPNQLTTAIMDVFLLSKCSELYGSSWSSFTELAQRLGQPRVKIAGRDFGSKKFALFYYPTSRNIGDDIQSIAAKQFLPTVDYLVDRDNQTVLWDYMGAKTVSDANIPNKSIKIIQNGWFDGRQTKFPPHRTLNPLFISFHLNETPDLYKEKEYARLAVTARHNDKLLTPDVIEYFQGLGTPIGTRDLHTLQMLEKSGVSAFHTSCLTLTLEGQRIGLSNPPNEKTNIIVVDAYHRETELYGKIPLDIREKAERLTHGLTHEVIPDFSKKHSLALSLLQKYQDARMVITDRLHVALPSLALGTPVFFIYSKMDTDPRYDDTFKSLLGNGKDGPEGWDWENPQITDEQKELIGKIKTALTRRIKQYMTTK